MTDAIVERVARAICEAEPFTESGREEYWLRHRHVYREAARAAIAAMREPTPDMLAKTLPVPGVEATPANTKLAEQALFLLEPEGFPAESHGAGLDAARDLITDYQAMIDAALGKK